jgi:DNA-directed RNA polymerase II subunit RPB11
MSNASDFILLKEDHTMGNLISCHLKKEPHVLFAAYKGMREPLPRISERPRLTFCARSCSSQRG